jgi:hypothetical protein
VDEVGALEAARTMRRGVLGDACVDAQAADPNPGRTAGSAIALGPSAHWARRNS